MFFSLTAPGPASPRRPSSGHHHGPPGPPVHARPPRGAPARREGGRPPGTARLCALPSPTNRSPAPGPIGAPPPSPPPPPPRAHPAPARGVGSVCVGGGGGGVPSPSGPRSGSRPGRPATSSAPPPLAPPRCPRSAASLAPCQPPGSPARAGELSGEGVCGEGCGPRRCPGRERPRCPAAAPRPRPLSGAP